MSRTPTHRNPNSDDDQSPAVLDALLSEMLGGVTPPSTTTRRRDPRNLSGKNRTPLAFTLEELRAAADLAWNETQLEAEIEPMRPPAVARTPMVVPPPVVLGRQSSLDTQSPDTRTFRRNSGRLFFLASAASTIGVILTVAVLQPWNTTVKLADSRPAFPKLGSGANDLSTAAESADSAIASTPSDRSTDTVASNSRLEPSQELTGGLETSERVANADSMGAANNPVEPNSSNQTSDQISASERKFARTAIPLGTSLDASRTAVIDQQFQHLWTRVSLTAENQSDLNSLENRYAMVLLGRLPTSAEREWVRRASVGMLESAHVLAKRWIESEEFDRHWAGLLAEYYLEEPTTDNSSEAKGQFMAWLQESIANDRPLGAVENDLMSAKSSAQQPAAHWMEHWVSFGSRQSPSLLKTKTNQAIGMTDSQLGSLESVSMQSMRLAGQRSVACQQCHVSTTANEDSPLGYVSDMFGETRSVISAIPPGPLFGVAALFAPSIQSAQPDLFYSDAEGKLVIASPMLPNREKVAAGEDRRQALGRWMQGSRETRAEIVDYVWFRMFGQPLLPRVGLTDDEGAVERRDLLMFLVDKTQDDSTSLRQLVYWIAMSAPMSVKPSDLEAKDFLKLDPNALAQFQRETRLFVRFPNTPTPGATAATPTAMRIDGLAKWIGGSVDAAGNALLAQPSVSGPIGVITTKQQAMDQSLEGWDRARVKFELSDALPYARVEALGIALADSHLDWNAIIDHSFLVGAGRFPSSEERQQAQKVLDWSAGNRRLATNRLVNALLRQL